MNCKKTHIYEKQLTFYTISNFKLIFRTLPSIKLCYLIIVLYYLHKLIFIFLNTSAKILKVSDVFCVP